MNSNFYSEEHEFDRLTIACYAITQLMQEFLQAKTITAQEFLSIVGQLPIPPVDRPF